MFAMTDEEMQQIEQLIECLIERNQDSSPKKLRSSNTTVNLPSKMRNA